MISANTCAPNINSTAFTSPASLSAIVNKPKSIIILATALVQVTNNWGIPILCRAVLDSGSQLNFVSESLAVQLGIRRNFAQTDISGIGDYNLSIRHSISTTITSNTSAYSADLTFLILPRISEQQPECHFNISHWNLPSSVQLADPLFFKPQKIDMLLGAEIYIELLINEQIRLADYLPILQNTRLGWIVTGRLPANKQTSLLAKKATSTSVASLEQLLRQFWEIETHTHVNKMLTAEEKMCEAHFSSTVRRATDGRFVVSLPFRQPPSVLGESVTTAKRRFFALERRLGKDSNIKQQYLQFMSEYENLHHMMRIGNYADFIANKQLVENCYFLPHHCVVKEESSSTKLRVVFDGSAKTTTSVSLNDILMTGPTVQADLFSVILRFRSYRYVFTSDISKMYRQIVVRPEDCRYQLILWRENPLAELGVYQLNTVTYGTSSAPFLATRCLTMLAENCLHQFPLASTALIKETYVDDIMTGANSLQEITTHMVDLQRLLGEAGFELRKYCSNTPELLRPIPEAHREPFMNIGGNNVVKTLGLIWLPSTDAFTYNISFVRPATITKRSVLSDLGRIFDPLGLIGPVVVRGKIFMQELWKLNISWDQSLPDMYGKRWTEYVNQLEAMNPIQIPRQIISSNAENIVQVHAFSDSSEAAYGACCYLRSVALNGQVCVRLICSKSRVAPTKSTSIAKLELQAALLAAELVERILNIIPIEINKRFFYTDSKIVLAWLAKPSYTWTTFVANRVAKIQELTKSDEWGYVTSKQNPADIISRGASPTEFMQRGPLTTAELDAARVALIINSQRTHLTAEFKALSRQNNVSKGSKLRSLDSFLDEEGLIRVGGRLRHSNLGYQAKHQIILPKNCTLTKILIFSYHFKYLHAGPQTLLSLLRQRYWPIDGKRLCNNTVHRCIRCFRIKPVRQDPFMGDLPKERVQPGRAFLTTGIDFCGPIMVHSQVRGRAPVKAYLAIFVCFTTKAVHIEAVSDLSTAAFIAALRRFIARRGLCTTIFSDNATNFVGAKNELIELNRLFQSEPHKQALLQLCQQNRIEWRMIPPKSPHFGGLWEAAVKQAKYHLVRVIANASLSFEELSTISAQIEAILNSRPLVPLPADPSDLEALTPGHFLIGEPLTSFPEPDITDANYNRLGRFRRLQQLQQIFWRRWSTDYLHLLQQRHKWTSNDSTLRPDMLVLIQDDNLPPYKWLLGRVISTIPGQDGVHRVAEIRTKLGIYKRTITKLYPLPLDD